jgi:hypothetical protein
MNPREIEVHIDELVLHGFDPRSRWAIGDAIESELRELLTQQGVPAPWRENPARLAPAPVRLTTPVETGKHLAAAIHGGKTR